MTTDKVSVILVDVDPMMVQAWQACLNEK